MLLLFVAVIIVLIFTGCICLVCQAKGTPVSVSAWILGIVGFKVNVGRPPTEKELPPGPTRKRRRRSGRRRR